MKIRKHNHFGLLFLLTLIVFLALLVNGLFTSLILYILIRKEILLVSSTFFLNLERLLLFNIFAHIPAAAVVAVIAAKFPLRPVRDLINGMDALASGNYDTRVKAGSIMKRYPPFVDLAESFNKMAQELENTEVLRQDFINDFSHEFKTPIVSISGFAKLLKRDDLTEAQRREYLDAIEEESKRLSIMATNVLNLSKVEQQMILTDVTQFNLSEQIRDCVLMLEGKWINKNIDLLLEFEEHDIFANEELLKQVWINLLDNAFKFVPDGHTVRVNIVEERQRLSVSVLNTGSVIPSEHLDKLFQKFYQADESRASEGNGLGLAIVNRIVQLHKGQITVESNNDVTEFTVRLPKNGDYEE